MKEDDHTGRMKKKLFAPSLTLHCSSVFPRPNNWTTTNLLLKNEGKKARRTGRWWQNCSSSHSSDYDDDVFASPSKITSSLLPIDMMMISYSSSGPTSLATKIGPNWPTDRWTILGIIICVFLLLPEAAGANGRSGRNSPSSPLCDFESPGSGHCAYWRFANSAQLRRAHMLGRDNHTEPAESGDEQQHNFYVVLTGGGTASNHYATRQVMISSASSTSSSSGTEPVAMLVSPFFARTAPQCELLFRFRLLGMPGAELLVATEQLSLAQFHPDAAAGAVPDEDEEDWTRPTLRAHFEPGAAGAGEPWAQARVGIGAVVYPTRIRVECHPPQAQDAHEHVDEEVGELSVECSVDDLELANCKEELWHGADSDAACPEGRISCRPLGGGPQLCLGADHICDMHPDCEEGEDELEDVHKCSQVPDGAKCDFEDLRWSTGCAQWRFFSGQAGGSGSNSSSASSGDHLVALADARQRRAGIPPGEYLGDGGRLYRAGHFLFFSSYDHHQSGAHDIVYSAAISPPMPRLPADAHDCSLRFFYCQTGSSPFQVLLAARRSGSGGAKPEMAKPLWAPPRDDHVREPCEWRRAAVGIGPTLANVEYVLKLSFAKLAGSMGSIAVDDLSLSPGCFVNGNARLLPDRLTLTACDESSGGTACAEMGAEGDSSAAQRWTVPSTGEYRLELAGAAGGAFPGRDNAWGDLLVANVRLEAGREIGAVLGRRGKCICDADGGQHSGEMHQLLCTHRLAVVLPEGIPEPDDLPGCGGGGASVFLYAGRPIAVAGGGGGDFPVPRSAGGELRSDRRHVAGDGMSLEKLDNATASCAGAQCMDGHAAPGGNLSEIRGGKCPPGTRWALAGGVGGGGASCGPGGGGGGGLQGGAAGLLAPGASGTSVLLMPEGTSASASAPRVLVQPRVNPGAGRLLLIACPQHQCPLGARCAWAPPQLGAPARALCTCAGGLQVSPGSASCAVPPTFWTRLLGLGHKELPPLVLLACLLLVLLCALLCCACCSLACRAWRRRAKRARCAADVHELMAIAAEAGGPAAAADGCVGNRISGNPIYEPLWLSPLPCIPRHLLRVEKSIGHGAFGEVFEGYMLDADGRAPPVKVALKSLPVESARDFGDDFEMEARLLSQFKHENIVAFFGVSFEQQPRYIVLEFLEGGDLKKFLRENRPKPDQPSDGPGALRMGDLLGAALDVARGCEHLEATRFVHRDIAARNCLLTAKVGRRVVKIADFGMARDIYRNDYYRKGGKAFLPVRWMPPESFLDGLFTSKTDVWAYGVLLWELFSLGYIPYSGREHREVMRLIVAGDRLDPPIGVPAEVYEVMLCCWHTDAEKRPRFAELVTLFEGFLKREDLVAEPLPPIRHRLASERSVSATPSMSRAGDPHPASTTSQATVSTMLSTSVVSAPAEGGTNSISTSTYECMPTAGDGVCRAVFPPYQTPRPVDEALMSMDNRRDGTNGVRQSSLSSSSSSHDSTLHESAGTVKLRHCIRRPPPLSLTTLRPLPKTFLPAVPPCPTSAGHHPGPNCSNFSASPSTARHTASFRVRNHSLPPQACTAKEVPEATAPADHDSGIASARSIASADAALLAELRREEQ